MSVHLILMCVCVWGGVLDCLNLLFFFFFRYLPDGINIGAQQEETDDGCSC